MIITQRNTLGREPFIGQEWNELPETIIEAANTEAFKLALRAQARLHWAFELFLFLYHQHKFTALFFSAHSTSTAHICWRWVVLPFADQTFRFRLGKFWGTVWQSKVWSVVQRKELSIGLSTKEQWLGLSTVLRTVSSQIMLWTVPFRLIITCVGN